MKIDPHCLDHAEQRGNIHASQAYSKKKYAPFQSYAGAEKGRLLPHQSSSQFRRFGMRSSHHPAGMCMQRMKVPCQFA